MKRVAPPAEILAMQIGGMPSVGGPVAVGGVGGMIETVAGEAEGVVTMIAWGIDRHVDVVGIVLRPIVIVEITGGEGVMGVAGVEAALEEGADRSGEAVGLSTVEWTNRLGPRVRDTCSEIWVKLPRQCIAAWIHLGLELAFSDTSS